MVWEGICVHFRTQLVVLIKTLTGQRCINEVLQPVVLPFNQHHHVVLQDDTRHPSGDDSTTDSAAEQCG